MGIFDQMSQAKVQGRGVKIQEDANFVVRVDKIKLEQSNQGFGQLWVVEFTIVEGTAENPAGAERSWVQRPETRQQTDPGNIKAFVAALDNIPDPNTAYIAPEAFSQAASEAQPYAGHHLRLNTQMVTTKSGFPFCVHTWSHFAGEAPAAPPQSAASQVPAGAPAPAAAAAAPLTEEAWKAGEGPAQQHPTNAEYEWNPEHPEWGIRPIKPPF